MNVGVRVTTLGHSEKAKYSLGGIQTRMDLHSRKLSTGQEIQGPGDDSGATNSAMLYMTSTRELLQMNNNVTRAQTIATLSYEALVEFKDTLVRAQEVTAAVDSELGSNLFTSYLGEVDQLIEGLVDLANVRALNQPLFAGTELGVVPFQTTKDVNGRITAVTYTGNTNTAEFYVTPQTKLSPQADGPVITQMLSSINDVIALRDALVAGDWNAVAAVEPNLVSGTDTLVDAMATLSTVVGRLSMAKNQNDTTLMQNQIQVSHDTSADVAQTIVDNQRLKVAYEAALKTYGQILARPGLIDYV